MYISNCGKKLLSSFLRDCSPILNKLHFFRVSTKETFFIKGQSRQNNSDSKLQSIKGAQSQSDSVLLYILYISHGLTLSTLFLNFFESELFYRNGPQIKMFLLLRHENNVIYSKLMNNPFKNPQCLSNQLYSLSTREYALCQTVNSKDLDFSTLPDPNLKIFKAFFYGILVTYIFG